jgi:transcriptional regulator with XRE-family HTH domain
MATAGSIRPSPRVGERPPLAAGAASPIPEGPAAEGLPPIVGVNLRRLRSKRGLSLERLSQRAGVSRAMLSQIELGRSVPTINLLWKIAQALGVTFSTFLSEQPAQVPVILPARKGQFLTNRAGTFTTRALFPFDGPRRSEFYEIRIDPEVEEPARPQPAGTSENVVVSTGTIEIGVDRTVYALETGDALLYAADRPHFYRNVGTVPAVLYVVVTYDATLG